MYWNSQEAGLPAFNIMAIRDQRHANANKQLTIADVDFAPLRHGLDHMTGKRF